MKNKFYANRWLVWGLFTCLTLAFSGGAARAQWLFTHTTNASYHDPANWAGGSVSDRLTGGGGVTLTTLPSAVFDAGSSVIYLSGFDARKLSVGQAVSGSGIPAGAYITAINNSGQITLSAPATGAGNGALTVTGWGAAASTAQILVNASGTIKGDFVYAITNNNDVSLGADGNPKWTFTAPKVNFVVDLGGSGTAKTLNFGASSRNFYLDFKGPNASGADVNFVIDPSTNLGSNFGQNGRLDVVNMSVTATGVGALTKSGAGTLVLGGQNASQNWSIAGPVTVTGGVLMLANASANRVGPVITGATRYDIIGPGSALALKVTGTYASQTASIPSLLENVPVNLWSGQLMARSDSAVNDLQTVGAVTLNSGRNSIALAISNSAFSLTLASLTRESYATLNLLGYYTNFGGPYVKVTNDTNILNSLTGGGGAAGSASLSIIPWITMTGSNMGSAWSGDLVPGDAYAYSGIDLVTYTSAGGFRALSGSEYDRTFAAAAVTGTNSNVWLAGNTTLSAAQTVNALKLNHSMTLALDDTLTVSSGVLIKATGGDSTISGGVIDSGASQLYIYGPNKLTVTAQLTNHYSGDGPGLILAQVTGTTVLANANSYGGSTLVQGAVAVMDSGAITNNELRVDLGGLFSIDGNTVKTQVTKLSGNGAVNLRGDASQLNIGGAAGADNTVTVSAGGILAPGDAAGLLQIGTLWLGDKVEALVFKQNSIFDLDLAGDTLSDQVSSLNPDATLSLNDGAILRLNFLNNYTPDADAQWLLAIGFAALSLGDCIIQDQNGSVLDHYTLTDLNHNLMLNYSAIPEPSALWLSLGGLVLLSLTKSWIKLGD